MGARLPILSLRKLLYKQRHALLRPHCLDQSPVYKGPIPLSKLDKECQFCQVLPSTNTLEPTQAVLALPLNECRLTHKFLSSMEINNIEALYIYLQRVLCTMCPI